jgi:hypothetical protein
MTGSVASGDPAIARILAVLGRNGTLFGASQANNSSFFILHA